MYFVIGDDQIAWGIDFSTTALSLAWDGCDVGVETRTFKKKLRDGQRLHVIYSETRDLAEHVAEDHRPSIVLIEQPSGRFRQLQLVYAAGVIQAAIYGVLGEVPVLTVPSKKWKKHVLGDGSHVKPKKDDDFVYQGIIWCRQQKLKVIDDNEADARCIARFAREATELS